VDIRQLRYFVQIAEAGSLSRAAEQLHLAQPALSQALRQLEAELGVELVTRHPRGIVPNEIGLLLVEHARALLAELGRTRELIRHHAKNPAGEVRLGLPPSVARGLTPALVRTSRQRFPDISLKVVEQLSGYLGEWLQLGRLDLAMIYDPKLLHMAATVRLHPILVEELHLISPPTPEFRNRKTIRFDTLGRYPLAHLARPHAIRVLLEGTAQKRDASLSFALDVDSLSGIVALVPEGYLTILPRFAVSKELAAGELCATPIVAPRLSWKVYVATAESGIRSAAVRAVYGVLMDVVGGLVRSGAWPARRL
jgi:LysR family nitrogen assimilation transcriptional regulator